MNSRSGPNSIFHAAVRLGGVAALLWVLPVQPVAGETLPSLTPEAVLSSSQTHFPRILTSLAQRRTAAGKALEAAGAFDLVFAADGFSRVDGFYDGTAINGVAKQNLRALGASMYVGYKLSDGDFPIYEDINYTNTGGTAKLGLLFSLLRDRDIDDRRFKEADARYEMREADLDVLLTKIGVQQRALIAYWRWVTAGRKLDVYQNLLQIAKDREQGLEEQVEQGARAEIYLVENRQNITRRQTLATTAERDFQMAANALSLYFRDERGLPHVPQREQLPTANAVDAQQDPLAAVSAGAARSAALMRRPELQLLRTAIERAQNRVTLARNDLKPKLNLNFELQSGLGSVAEGGPSRDSTDTIVGFTFSVPLQQRSAEGRLWQQQAEIESMRYRQQLQEDQIEVEVKNILLDLSTAQRLLRLAEQEVEQAEILREAEERRFDSGASDFFLVNVREETAANARIRYFVADLERRISRANYDAATVDLQRLGITDEFAIR